MRGNHAFALDHLLRLVAEAGLGPEPVIDARMARRAENAPRDAAGVREFGLAGEHDLVLMTRDHGGVVSGPVALVLRPGTGAPPPTVVGLEATTAWLHIRISR